MDQAYALGKAAIDAVLNGKDGIMLTIVRESNLPYRWSIGEAPLSEVANVEWTVPKNYIREDGFHITPACREYLAPLIVGEDYPPYNNGLPKYVKLKNRSL